MALSLYGRAMQHGVGTVTGDCMRVRGWVECLLSDGSAFLMRIERNNLIRWLYAWGEKTNFDEQYCTGIAMFDSCTTSNCISGSE